jgi:anti-sigma B factor antagonist
VVDLKRATFIDSTTLGVLIAAVKRVRPVGGTLAIVCADENVRRIFELTGLDKVFPIRSSREEAIAATA